ncbi:hypothetical protein BDV25DRAFT_162066 [Aspergillus avenaceus]|uniref:Uncharacterized protein n=1 Tax=Aspergillus avenaceus TaxID=36643 RepID=A0A5N6TJZ8_ASPAV|nr:hypothetical protein BDV25DRAFT_162066 [Aspergillus avenaceus]
MLLQSPCVLEGWSTDLFQHLRYEGLSVVCESLSSSPSVYSTAAKTTYGVERIGSHLSRSLWERALESIPSHTKDPGNDVNESIIMAFIQVHAFVKDPIDGLRRDFDRQRQTFLELWTDFKRQYSTRRPLNESTRQTIFAQLAQESSFLAIPKLTKLAYLHYSDHQQLPYAYASIKKLRRAEFSTPIRVLEIVRELFLMTMDQGFSSMAPITVTYRPGADRQGRRFKVVLDGNNRLVAISLLQFLSYQPLSTERGALQNFFQKLGYDEKWLAELDEVLNKLRQEKSLLQLVQDHSNALEYFRSVTRAPILIVQEDEFHTVYGCSSCLAFEAKRQSHGRPKGFYPLPLQ